MTNRIRYLKPDFFLDEDIATLPPLIRLFYAGLWTHADRDGRLEDRPQRLKAEIMPYEDGFNADEALTVLARPKKKSRRPYIVRYEVTGEQYVQILSWARHQRPHKNERDSEIPPPPGDSKMSYKGRTQDGQEHDTGRSLEHGDCDGDCDGNRDGEGECEGETKKINPPAPIHGSGHSSEASARPSLIITEETIREYLKIKSHEEVLEMLRKGNHPIPEWFLAEVEKKRRTA